MCTDPEVGIRLSADSGLDDQQLDQLYGQSSLSGKERNHLFLARNGERFLDLSEISGLDHIGDSRAFALLDFDRDGWLDVAMVNANAPFFQLFHNRIGPHGASATELPSLALRFVGGNHVSQATHKLSNRDGIGAVVTADLGDLWIRREVRAGEGFAAQNRSTMLIGLGARPEVHSLRVQWPSGRQLETGPVPAGTLVTLYEDPAHSPTELAYTVEVYRAGDLPKLEPRPRSQRTLSVATSLAATLEARLLMFTSVATWCEACRREIPHLRRLRDRFESSELAMFGVPVDPEDTRDKLRDYASARTPPYRLLVDLAPQDSEEFRARVLEMLHYEALPSTFITDREGQILYAEAGVPTISDLRELLSRFEPSR